MTIFHSYVTNYPRVSFFNTETLELELPSGNLTVCWWKWPSREFANFPGKSMMMFHSYVSFQRVSLISIWVDGVGWVHRISNGGVSHTGNVWGPHYVFFELRWDWSGGITSTSTVVRWMMMWWYIMRYTVYTRWNAMIPSEIQVCVDIVQWYNNIIIYIIWYVIRYN